ncbi:heptaprenyl diphosphate synthase component 1 [Litchfieldia salsa]
MKITNFKKRIEGEINHSYLHKYLNPPKIDEDKLLLLYTIFEEIEIGEKELEHYVLTTMLIQLALDTHDQVSTSPTSTSEDLLKNQLTVLAGDYFSGLYYYFLAQEGDIPMIRSLAEATKEVNEHKIKVYQCDITQIDTLLESIEKIESLLISQVTQYFQLSKWEDFISKFLLLKRLLHERELYTREGVSPVIDAFHNVLQSQFKLTSESFEREEIKNKFDLYIYDVKTSLLQLVSKNFKCNQTLEVRINQLLNCQPQLSMKKIVEEGS